MIEIIEGILFLLLGAYGYKWKAGKLNLNERQLARREKILSSKRGPVIMDLVIYLMSFCGFVLIILSIIQKFTFD